jgi:hypothetical protein
MFGVWTIEGGLSIILEHSARTELSASDSLRSDVDTEKVGSWASGRTDAAAVLRDHPRSAISSMNQTEYLLRN